MRKIGKLLILTTLLTFMLQSFTFASTVSIIRPVHIKTLEQKIEDNYYYDKGITYIQNNEIMYEEEKINGTTTLKIVSGENISKVVYSDDSDYFIVTENGETKTYNRNDFNSKSVNLRASYGNYQDYGIGLKEIYTAKELERRNFTFNGTTKIARLLEDYTWSESDYSIKDFAKYDSVTLIIGVLGMSYKGVVAILGALITIKEGIECIADVVSINTFKVEEYTNKYGKIYSESGSYYHSGKTRVWKLVRIDGENVYESEVIKNTQSGDFNNNSSILTSIINAYIAVNSY